MHFITTHGNHACRSAQIYVVHRQLSPAYLLTAITPDPQHDMLDIICVQHMYYCLVLPDSCVGGFVLTMSLFWTGCDGPQPWVKDGVRLYVPQSYLHQYVCSVATAGL
jgi:hypothetical protein